ncbi:transmembrane protein 81 isoform X2 [Pseudochaenichthys georgianus]|uniref:transmembrane protein 81 isoform X2 n=1 Tax=Pseudochaenichthys georgianus TaxID=52239 RepID=UPI00146AFF8B|nr:transmembrane protein 81 isoform X2 [Pseudochaenichthys georgianus]
MQHVTVRFLLFFLLLLLHPVTSVDLEEVDKVSVEVIVDSSPCSATCGLGVKTQTLCLLKDGKKAMEEDVRSKDGTEVSEECRVRKLSCLESWQCGLRTMTVTLGERVEIDCLGEVMQAMGRFSWRVSWRYARGIISSDDTLFARWNAPLLERVVLDPVMEEDAGCQLPQGEEGLLGDPGFAILCTQSGLRELSGPVGLWKPEAEPDRVRPENASDLHCADQFEPGGRRCWSDAAGPLVDTEEERVHVLTQL